MDSIQYAIELVTYFLVHVVYFYELIVYMLWERNAIDSIALFSQCEIIYLCLRSIITIYITTLTISNLATKSEKLMIEKWTLKTNNRNKCNLLKYLVVNNEFSTSFL